MPGNPRAAIMLAERRFPVRIRVGIPPEGLGRRHAQLTETTGRTFRVREDKPAPRLATGPHSTP
jgi:hypothetical protein